MHATAKGRGPNSAQKMSGEPICLSAECRLSLSSGTELTAGNGFSWIFQHKEGVRMIILPYLTAY
jgi:hypothetical protein